MLLAQPKNLEEQEKKIFLRSSFDPLALSDLVPMVAYLRLMVLSEEHPWASRPEVLVPWNACEKYRDAIHYDNGTLFFPECRHVAAGPLLLSMHPSVYMECSNLQTP